MSKPKLNNTLAQEAVNTFAKHGNNQRAAAAALGIPRTTFQARLDDGRHRGLKPNGGQIDPDSPQALYAQVRRLEAELRRAQATSSEIEAVRNIVGGLSNKVAELKPPPFIAVGPNTPSSPGVPTLFLSDWHAGEVVYPTQINHVNQYNLTIMRERVAALVKSAAHLLGIISPKMDYPGIVVPLGGDMISGNIHEELTATNELNSMPTVLELYGVLVGIIDELARIFGHVFLPCVTGNHGRDTRKIWAKDRHHTSFDWLLYQFLARHFEKDKRITFYIPDGPDAYYKIYQHRYLLTHGDQFRGGDGIIGPLGPIIRGDHKKRSRNAQVDMEYDTMICGHWHQYIHLSRLIVNGALKGYDEYAYANNFPFEPPSQALWLTHPKYRITYRMPVYVDRQRKPAKAAWVSVPK
ncbi:MAG TPA: hypothetical protein VJL59_22675 [Anaerolineales bacterium]|nr:hypothetical protein [Anaerolineales bacterium]